jgi:hypothetical protein
MRGMRAILLIALCLAACSREQQSSEVGLNPGTFAGQGRDRLCIAGEGSSLRAGLIAYGPSDANCTAAGRLERSGNGWALIPRGEGECRIPLSIEGNVVRVGQPPASCAYYCGPGAGLAGKSFSRADMGAKAVDFAGDPLC